MERKYSCANPPALVRCTRLFDAVADLEAREALRQPIEPEIDHRRGVERQQLADQQAADDRDAQRMAQFRSGAAAEASGRPPSSAAMVVIMMGRKRSRQAW